MAFRFQVQLLMLTRSTVQKQIFFSPGVLVVLNSKPASCKEKNFSPQSSLPAFLAHLFNADSGLSQSGRCGIFVVKPIDYPNCFMTQAQFVINCSLWVGNHMFPDSHPQMHTPLAPRVDEGIQSDADSTHLSLRNHWRTQAVLNQSTGNYRGWLRGLLNWFVVIILCNNISGNKWQLWFLSRFSTEKVRYVLMIWACARGHGKDKVNLKQQWEAFNLCYTV